MDHIEEPQIPKSTFLNLDRGKQKRVIEAAFDEFSSHGYKGASINALVRAVGISKGSIFQYFKNKEGLFLFLINYATGLVKTYLKRVRGENADEDVFERIRQTMLAGVEFVRRNPKIYSLYLRLMFETGIPHRSDLIQTIRRLSIGYLAGLLEEGKTKGEIAPEVDVPKAAFFLDSILDRALQAYGTKYVDLEQGLYAATPETIEHWADYVAEFCRSGLGVPSVDKTLKTQDGRSYDDDSAARRG